jgi:hypothetical protein
VPFLTSTNPVVTISGSDPVVSTGGPTPIISIQDATVEQKGAVQLEDSVSSNSVIKAATPKNVKEIHDYTTTISGSLQADIDNKLENIAEDITPQLGGDLDGGGYNFDNVGKLCSVSSSVNVCNDTGSTINKGTAVTICDLSGETCCVCVADNREATKMPACGILNETITTGNFGCMVVLGRVCMDTLGFTGNVGDRLYVQSDGSIDTTIPTSGSVQRVGFLTKKASGAAGRVCVCTRGRRSIYAAKDEHPTMRMGDDVGHRKVCFLDYNNNEVGCIDSDGNLTVSGTIQLGGNLDVNGHNINYGAILSVNNEYEGDIVTVTVDDASAAFGNPLYCATDFHYERCDADAAITMPCVCLALESGAGSKKVLLKGQICDTAWSWNAGLVYVSCTTGELTQTTVSGSGDQAQIVGFATHANTMFFNPNYMLIEIS